MSDDSYRAHHDLASILKTSNRDSSSSSITADSGSSFKNKISFDTSDVDIGPKLQVCLKKEHVNYCFSRTSRTFLVIVDDDLVAISWALSSIIYDNDIVVCLYGANEFASHERYVKRASDLVEAIMKLTDKAISLILELVEQDLQRVLEDAIREYIPSVVIVSDDKRKRRRPFFSTSFAQFVVKKSPLPVIIVKSDSTREHLHSRAVANTPRDAGSGGSTLKVYDDELSDNTPPQLPAALKELWSQEDNGLTPSKSPPWKVMEKCEKLSDVLFHN